MNDLLNATFIGTAYETTIRIFFKEPLDSQAAPRTAIVQISHARKGVTRTRKLTGNSHIVKLYQQEMGRNILDHRRRPFQTHRHGIVTSMPAVTALAMEGLNVETLIEKIEALAKSGTPKISSAKTTIIFEISANPDQRQKTAQDITRIRDQVKAIHEQLEHLSRKRPAGQKVNRRPKSPSR